MAHSSPRHASRRAGKPHAPPPSRPADPVRLAALRAYAAFRAGGSFRSVAPPALAEKPQRRLYTNLLRGMVRHQRLLEAEAARLARRPAEELSPPVMAALVLGLYQVLMLRQADHAAVFETVETLGAIGQGRAKGLVNAVLRSALRERPEAPDEKTAPRLAHGRPLAERTSHPDWLVERWTRHYGAEAAERICEANNRFDTTGVRVNLTRTTRDALIARLAEEGVDASPHPLLPGALLVHQVGALLESAAFAEGLCYVQDAGSQLVSAFMAAVPSRPLLSGRVLDACCAPGGKLTHLLELSRSGAVPHSVSQSAPLRLVGMDSSFERLRRVRENLRRLRLSTSQQSVLLVAGDAARLPFAPSGSADGGGADGSTHGWDGVLLDVPCSATGMIRKYPELKWRKHEQDLAKLATVQRAHLDAAARAVRPGGWITYVTCSLEPEENERQVEAFLARTPGFRREPLNAGAPPLELAAAAVCLTAAGDIQLLPDTDHMGIYAALLRREGITLERPVPVRL